MTDAKDQQQQHAVEDNNKEAEEVSMKIDNGGAEGEKASNSKAEGNGVKAGEEIAAKNITQGKRKRGRKPKADRPSTEESKALEKTSGQKAIKVAEPFSPASERPAREKKSVERFVASPAASDRVRGFVIEKGHGTQLKDIPNVAYNISKRSRADDIVKILHSVLYGKRVKAFHVKNNILQFSGFVWGENKDRGKVKEKLEKLHKDSLANLCDVLDVHCSKTANKKEELITKLIEFLESPHVTSNVSLEEKDQESKPKNRKRGPKRTPGKTVVKSSRKKRKLISGSSKEEARTGEVEENEDQSEGENEHEEDEAIEEEPEKESVDRKNEKEGDYRAKRDSEKNARRGPKRRVKKGRPVSKKEETKSKLRGKALKSPSKGIAEQNRRVKSEQNVGKDENGREGRQRRRKAVGSAIKGAKTVTKRAETTQSKKHLVEVERETYDDGSPIRKRQSSSTGTTAHFRENECDTKIAVSGAQDSPSNISRKNGKERNDADKPWSTIDSKTSKREGNETGGDKRQGPTDEEMQLAIAEFLSEVDFNTATLSDIVNRLGERFDSDFTQRKAEVKKMIQEELAKIVEEDDEEEN